VQQSKKARGGNKNGRQGQRQMRWLGGHQGLQAVVRLHTGSVLPSFAPAGVRP